MFFRRAGAKSAVLALSLGVLASCALTDALQDAGIKQEVRPAKQAKPAVRDSWEPPPPYPEKRVKVPVPGPKPGLASKTGAKSAGSGAADLKKTAAPGDIAPWPVVKPEDVVGRDEKGVLALLGPPDAKTEKPPARIWRYLEDECILAAAFYLDVNDQKFRALSVAAEKIGGGSYAADRCLARILAKQSARK